METINWRRVGLGGLLAGVVLSILAVGCAALFIGQTHLRALRLTGANAASIFFFIGVFLFLGLLMTWWYAAIRPRFGAGPKTAAIAGLAVWLIVVSQVLKSAALYETSLSLPAGPLLPILYLVMIVASTEVGAWVYQEQERAKS